MIGDIYLFMQQLLKQTFCIHEYVYREIGMHCFEECKKCGRVKL